MASISQQELARRFVEGRLDDTEVYLSRGVVATARAFYCDGALLALFEGGVTGAEALRTGKKLLLRNSNPAWGGPSVSRSVSYALNLLANATGPTQIYQVVDNASWAFEVGHPDLVRALALAATAPEARASLPKGADGSPQPEPCIALPPHGSNRELCDRHLRRAGYFVPDDILDRALGDDELLLVDAAHRRVEVIAKADAKTRMIPVVWYPPNGTYGLDLPDGRGGTARVSMNGLAALVAPSAPDAPAAPSTGPAGSKPEPEAESPSERPLSVPSSDGTVEETKALIVEATREFVRAEIAAAFRPVSVHVSVIEHILARVIGMDAQALSETILEKVDEVMDRFEGPDPRPSGDGVAGRPTGAPVDTLYGTDPELGF